MDTRIRRAHNSDTEIIQHIVYACLDEFGLQADHYGTDADLDDIDAHYNKAGGYFCVVEHDGRVIACGGLLRHSEHRLELRKMYMRASYRGKGIGKALLEHLIAEARTLAAREIVLETAQVLQSALALYKAYGFVEARDVTLSHRCDQALKLSL